MGFYWSGLSCPAPGDLPDPGIQPKCLMSPALTGGFFTTSTAWECIHISPLPGTSLSTPLVYHRAPLGGSLSYTTASHWLSVLHMVVCTRQSYSLDLSHSLLPSLCPQVLSLYFSFKVFFDSQFLSPCDKRSGAGIIQHLIPAQIRTLHACLCTSCCIACWELSFMSMCIEQGVERREAEKYQNLACGSGHSLHALEAQMRLFWWICLPCIPVLARNREEDQYFL